MLNHKNGDSTWSQSKGWEVRCMTEKEKQTLCEDTPHAWCLDIHIYCEIQLKCWWARYRYILFFASPELMDLVSKNHHWVSLSILGNTCSGCSQLLEWARKHVFRRELCGTFLARKFTRFKIGCVFYFWTAIKMTVLFSVVEFGIQLAEAGTCVCPALSCRVIVAVLGAAIIPFYRAQNDQSLQPVLLHSC